MEYGNGNLARVKPGMINEIKAHLAAGNEILIRTHYKAQILNKKHIDYIHADSKPTALGYWLGWTDKKKVYCMIDYIFFIKPGT